MLHCDGLLKKNIFLTIEVRLSWVIDLYVIWN